MAKKNSKPVNKKVSKQKAPSLGFVPWKDRSQEVADRIAIRAEALDKENKKKNKK
tara:strand:+ start:1248 stop:1412 length:165 start_codon:yes stop_codon:yes gene_type:complete